MAEKSILWTTGGAGDGASAYTQDETIRLFRYLNGNDPATQFVLPGVDSELAVSGATSPISIAPGAAWVYGFFYWSDSVVTKTVSTPTATTGKRVVLQADFTARTVRIVVLTSPDGNPAIPALTQTPGSIYEVSLATFQIDNGGNIVSLTDTRGFIHGATKVDSAMLDQNAVTNSALRDSAALSVIGRGANSSGDPADIAAGTDGHVLRRSGTTLAFGQIALGAIPDGLITAVKLSDGAGSGIDADLLDGVQGSGYAVAAKGVTNGDTHDHNGGDGAQIPTGGIADNAIDDTKAGNRVPQFYRRQGGSSTNWSTYGGTDYTPTAVRVQAGVAQVSVSANQTEGSLAITFPVAFSNAPVVVVSMQPPSLFSQDMFTVQAVAPSASGFTIGIKKATSQPSLYYFVVSWLAIGPE